MAFTSANLVVDSEEFQDPQDAGETDLLNPHASIGAGGDTARSTDASWEALPTPDTSAILLGREVRAADGPGRTSAWASGSAMDEPPPPHTPRTGTHMRGTPNGARAGVA